MPSPEELARQNIDALLEKCGWTLQTRSTINPDTARGIAIREALLKGGDEVDCLLLVKISICLCCCATVALSSPMVHCCCTSVVCCSATLLCSFRTR